MIESGMLTRLADAVIASLAQAGTDHAMAVLPSRRSPAARPVPSSSGPRPISRRSDDRPMPAGDAESRAMTGQAGLDTGPPAAARKGPPLPAVASHPVGELKRMRGNSGRPGWDLL